MVVCLVAFRWIYLSTLLIRWCLLVLIVLVMSFLVFFFFFFQAEDGIRDADVTGVQTCALPILDDVLDYLGDAEAMGKNVGDDLAEGKTTLPLIYAMANGSDEERQLIRQAIRKRSEEHTSELQSRPHLVCRLLLEKKKIYSVASN